MYWRLILIVTIFLTAVFNSFSLESLDPEKEKLISVEIKGEVKEPGVYELKLGSTYEDLFELSGLNEEADLNGFYLDETLYHEMLVVVPKKSEKRLISINSAGIDELITLPGIGEAIASRIIEYRKEKGSFLKIEDIMNVKGIGRGKFLQIREYITL